MTQKRTRHTLGIENTPTNVEGIGGQDLTRNGELATDSSDDELKVRLGGATRTVVTENQTQSLTNKSVDADNNTISNLETDNLKAGVLNTSTSLAAASNTQVPSALAVKTYADSGDATNASATSTVASDLAAHIADTVDAHDASAISNIPAGNIAATDVQSALNELDSEKAKINGDIAQSFSVLRLAEATSTDSATTGSNASLAAFTTGIVRLTNGSLVSLANIPAGSAGQQLELVNRTGAPVIIVDSSAAVGTAANRIYTGSEVNITMAINATLLFDYDLTSTRWQVVGGSGSGAATSAVDNVFNINDSGDPTKQINFDAGGTTSTKTTIAAAQTANRTVTLPDATDTLVGKATTDILTNKSISGSTNTITNVSLTAGVTGTLPLANGGTNATTKAGAFDSLSPMTTAGDLISGGASGTGTRLPVGQSTQVLRTVSGTPAWSEEDRFNFLLNPNFEGTNTAGVATSWTNSSTGSTATITTTSGEFSEGSQAQKIALSAGVLNFFQSQNTPAGIVKQGRVGVTYRAATAIAGFQICSLVDGVEQVCVPTANLIVDDAFHTIEIPIIFGSTSAGIKLKSTSSTGNVFIDSAYVKTGNSLTNLQLNTVYSAFINGATAAVTNENTDWISGNGVHTGTGDNLLTFASGIFTVAPNCVATVQDNVIRSVQVVTTATTAQILTTNSTVNTPLNANVVLTCQKQGVDYTNSSAQVYSQASANFGPINQGTISIGAVTTPPTKGTIVTDRWISSRLGNRLIADGQYDQTAGAGTAGSGDYLFTLPGGVSFDSNSVFFFTGNLETGLTGSMAKAFVGTGALSSGTSGSYHGLVQLVAYDATRFRAVVSYGNGASSGVSSQPIGSGFFALNSIIGFQLHIDAPIANWSNSNYIVGSLYALSDVAALSYTVANNTSGGSGVATSWNDRPLNTIDSDPNSIVTSLSSNTVTLPAGTYELLANAQTNNTNQARLRWRNTADSTTTCQGVNSSDEVVNASTPSITSCIFTITSSKTFKLQQWVTTNSGATALGRPVNSGDSEVYAQVVIRRLK